MIKAINHLKFRFGQDRININNKDLEALNEVIRFYNDVQQKTLNSQELFLKLFLEMFLQETTIHSRTSIEAVRKIENVLKNNVDDYYKLLAEEIPLLRFEYQLKEHGAIPAYTVEEGKIKLNNSQEVQKKNKEILDKNQKLLIRALQTEMTPEQAKDFLRPLIFEMINNLKNSKHEDRGN